MAASAPATAPAAGWSWAEIVPAALMVLLGLFLLFRADRFVAFLQRGLAWQRRNIPDPSLNLQDRIVGSRVLLWLFRTVGALLLLGAAIAVVKGGAA